MDDYISRINIHTILVCKHYESYLRLEYFFLLQPWPKAFKCIIIYYLRYPTIAWLLYHHQVTGLQANFLKPFSHLSKAQKASKITLS